MAADAVGWLRSTKSIKPGIIVLCNISPGLVDGRDSLTLICGVTIVVTAVTAATGVVTRGGPPACHALRPRSPFSPCNVE